MDDDIDDLRLQLALVTDDRDGFAESFRLARKLLGDLSLGGYLDHVSPELQLRLDAILRKKIQ